MLRSATQLAATETQSGTSMTMAITENGGGGVEESGEPSTMQPIHACPLLPLAGLEWHGTLTWQFPPSHENGVENNKIKQN